MEVFGGLLVVVIFIGVLVFVLPRVMGGNRITCNRCDGTGQINERWPDPAEPSGFHVAKGTCPKCKGKGKVTP
ncbi:MAG TPA: hypothetical protein VNK05_02285 [Chloroflexota bacterium]|jgi:hypothetical protein|nr:hypothetical protein [Chloroflexota bacterium]